MNIRKQIKSYGMTLSELANNLFVSRPTLNSYIQLYERNEEIPSKRYQIIFNKLFSKQLSQEEFYEGVKGYNKLLAKDEILEITELSPEQSDLISAIVKDIKEDLFKDSPNENVYSFIRFIINHYRKIKPLINLSNYFLTLNGVTNYNSYSKEEKKYMLYYYNFHNTLKKNEININLKNTEKRFVQKIEERKIQNEKAKEQLRDKINKMISEQVSKEIAAGKTVEEIDLNDIIRKISIKNNGS